MLNASRSYKEVSGIRLCTMKDRPFPAPEKVDKFLDSEGPVPVPKPWSVPRGRKMQRNQFVQFVFWFVFDGGGEEVGGTEVELKWGKGLRICTWKGNRREPGWLGQGW